MLQTRGLSSTFRCFYRVLGVQEVRDCSSATHFATHFAQPKAEGDTLAVAHTVHQCHSYIIERVAPLAGCVAPLLLAGICAAWIPRPAPPPAPPHTRLHVWGWGWWGDGLEREGLGLGERGFWLRGGFRGVGLL